MKAPVFQRLRCCILPTSKAGDGAQTGYDLPVIMAIKEAVSADVVASGGAGKLEHFYEAVQADGGVWRAKILCKFLPKDDRELLSQDPKNNHRVFEQ